MKKLDEIHLNRCNVNIEDDCKDWFMIKAKSMGMSMSQLMSFILTNYYDAQLNADAMKNISAMNQNPALTEANKNLVEMMLQIQNHIDKNELI